MKDTIKFIEKKESTSEPLFIYESTFGEWIDMDFMCDMFNYSITIEINSKPVLFYASIEEFFYEMVVGSKTYEKYKCVGHSCENYICFETFYPFTCECGEAGCAGIHYAIDSKIRKKSVEWRIPKEEEKYKTFLDKTFYSFDRQQYFSEIERLVNLTLDIPETIRNETSLTRLKKHKMYKGSHLEKMISKRKL